MRRKLIWGVIALLIAGMVIRTVMAQSAALSPRSLIVTMAHTPPAWMVLILLSMAGFIVFEALALRCILTGLGYPTSFRHALLYSAGDQFFSAITPSATGGQPASALFMGAHSLPAGTITVTLLLNLVLYTAATLTIGLGIFALRPHVLGLFGPMSRALILLGMTALIGLALVFLLLLTRGAYLERHGGKLIRLLSKLRLMKYPDKWMDQLQHLVLEYKLCAKKAYEKPGMLLGAFTLDLAQRISQISVTLLVYLSQGGNPRLGADLWSVQALAQIGSNWVPIPGGMGAADYLMLDGFQKLMQGDAVYSLQLLSRGFSFYVCSLVSGIIVLIGFICLRRQKHK